MTLPNKKSAESHLIQAQQHIERALWEGDWTHKQRRLITDTHRQLRDYIRMQKARKAVVNATAL